MPHIEISETALSYPQEHAEPLTDTTVTVLDRLLAEHAALTEKAIHSAKTLEMALRWSQPSPGQVHDDPQREDSPASPHPRSIGTISLEDLIAACIAKGAAASDIRALLQANILDGNQSENGYRFVLRRAFPSRGWRPIAYARTWRCSVSGSRSPSISRSVGRTRKRQLSRTSLPGS